MATYIREEVIPSYVDNATVKKVIRVEDNRHMRYEITPNDGYVLHDKGYDTIVYDEETLEPTGEVILGYRRTTASCPASYDFDVNENEYYCVPEADVPADQIFGVTNPPAEVM